MSTFLSHCPECGQQATTVGLTCGYGSLSGCYKNPSRRQEIPVLHDYWKMAGGKTIEAPKCVMCEVYEQQLLREKNIRYTLYEMLEREKLKNHAYSMLWSAKEYLRQMWGARPQSAYDHANHILSDALNTLDREQVDGKSIRDKYARAITKEYFYSGKAERDGWVPSEPCGTPPSYRDIPKDQEAAPKEIPARPKYPKVGSEYGGPRC